MHHFIYATKDTWISSGSNSDTTGISERDQNYGQDPVLELKKNFYNDQFDYQTRILLSFAGTEFNEMSQSIVNGDITDPTFFLRLYEGEGNKELSTTYTLAALPLSQSWDEGTGKFGDSPKVVNGASWENRNNYPGSTETTWSKASGDPAHGAATHSIDELGVSGSAQVFTYQSPDIEMDITNMVKAWLSGSQPGGFDNEGTMIQFSGSQEIDSNTTGQLKFFSTQTHTIYPPKLEVRWDDHASATNDNTGSLNELTMSGLVDNYLYMKSLRESYKENERVKFRIGARKRYIQRRFDTSVQTITGSYITEGSGSYSIKDIATGETIVPFSPYTSMSCDAESPYFIQWLNGFAPDRVYKILLKLKTDDGQEQIFDDNFEFVVKR